MGMAGDAFDALFLVFLVIEGKRLFSPGAYPEANEEEEYYNPDSQPDEEGFHFPVPWIVWFSPLKILYNNTSIELQFFFNSVSQLFSGASGR